MHALVDVQVFLELCVAALRESYFNVLAAPPAEAGHDCKAPPLLGIEAVEDIRSCYDGCCCVKM